MLQSIYQQKSIFNHSKSACNSASIFRDHMGGHLPLCQGSVTRVLKGENPGIVVDETHRTWYRELFSPGVTAGILQPADLAGYRTDQVYIRQSMHTPPNRDAVRDLMPALFDLIKEAPNPAVRAVLGHFMFVYIRIWMATGALGVF